MQEIDYIFGTDPEELHRLGFQHRVWAEEAFQSWQSADLKKGAKILDIGSGPGFATVELSYLTSENGEVTALEKSPKFINYLDNYSKSQALKNIKLVNSDIEDWDAPDNYFDIAYSRWVFSWLGNPEKALKNISRSLKNDGKIIFQEYCYWGALELVPKNQAFDKFYRAARNSFDLDIGNVDIGYELPQMLDDLGYNILNIKPLVKVGIPGSKVWNWVASFGRIYGEKLIERNLLSNKDYRDFLNMLQNLEKSKSAFISSPQMIEIIATKNIK